MKPKQGQNHHQSPGPNWQGKAVDEKTSVSKAKQTSKVSFSAHVKPFAGKVFYLDLQSSRTAETLERDIKHLGGTVEKFFSKEIKYLVSNKREAKHVHCLRQDSPVPSPDSGLSSPHPHSKRQPSSNNVDNVKSRPQGSVDTVIKSRGKSLVERVVTGQGRVQMDRILSNALEWGVKILYLDDVLVYIQKKKKIFRSHVSKTAADKLQVKVEASAKVFQKSKAGRIAKPFIKVEDSSRHYRPIYTTMPHLPEFYLTTAAPYSPFCVEGKHPSGIKQHGHRRVKAPAAEEKGRKKNREKKRGGYCECCLVKYDQLKMHLQSERHKAFSRSDEYMVVDQLVSALHFSFLPIKANASRPKCSVSSVLLVPEPCGEAGRILQGDDSPSQTIKAEEDLIGYASAESYLGNMCVQGKKRNCYTYSDSSKQRFLVCRRTARRKLSTPKPEWITSPQLNSENTHLDGEFVASSPSKEDYVSFVGKIPHKDTNSSVSYLLGTNFRSEASASNFSAVTHGPEDTNKDTVLFESVQELKTFSQTENIFSEKEEEIPYVPIVSTLQKIERKIKVYKHKRRKVDTNLESVEQGPENSLLKLWEIFQSSDDMDEEFLGFID